MQQELTAARESACPAWDGFRAKGVLAIGSPPCMAAALALTVLARSQIRTVADLKGKKIGVTTLGSLTDWLVRKLSQQQGWGPDGIQVMALGAVPARLAAMERNELDGMVIESATARAGGTGQGPQRALFATSEAHTRMWSSPPKHDHETAELLQRFLRGWFNTIAFMRANKAAAVKSGARVVEVRESIVAKVYDTQIGSFSADGAWDLQSIDVIRNSLKDLGILDFVPEAKVIYNDKFVPVKF